MIYCIYLKLEITKFSAKAIGTYRQISSSRLHMMLLETTDLRVAIITFGTLITAIRILSSTSESVTNFAETTCIQKSNL